MEVLINILFNYVLFSIKS